MISFCLVHRKTKFSPNENKNQINLSSRVNLVTLRFYLPARGFAEERSRITKLLPIQRRCYTCNTTLTPTKSAASITSRTRDGWPDLPYHKHTLSRCNDDYVTRSKELRVMHYSVLSFRAIFLCNFFASFSFHFRLAGDPWERRQQQWSSHTLGAFV